MSEPLSPEKRITLTMAVAVAIGSAVFAAGGATVATQLALRGKLDAIRFTIDSTARDGISKAVTTALLEQKTQGDTARAQDHRLLLALFCENHPKDSLCSRRP